MKGLLLKDFYIIREYGRSILLIVLIYMGVMIFSDIRPGVGADGFVAAYIPAFALTTISIDERNNWLCCVDCLPLSRKDIVLGKYLMIIILCCAGAVLFASVRFFKEGFASAAELFTTNIGFGLLINAFSMPLTFKFGVEKSRYFNAIEIALMVVLLITLRNIGIDVSCGLIILAVSVAFTILSFMVSAGFFVKRDL